MPHQYIYQITDFLDVVCGSYHQSYKNKTHKFTTHKPTKNKNFSVLHSKASLTFQYLAKEILDVAYINWLIESKFHTKINNIHELIKK